MIWLSQNNRRKHLKRSHTNLIGGVYRDMNLDVNRISKKINIFSDLYSMSVDHTLQPNKT